MAQQENSAGNHAILSGVSLKVIGMKIESDILQFVLHMEIFLCNDITFPIPLHYLSHYSALYFTLIGALQKLRSQTSNELGRRTWTIERDLSSRS